MEVDSYIFKHSKNKDSMSYLVMLGSDMFYGTNGILSVETKDQKFKEFFRIREFHRVRSEGSYLVIDCDIKDKDNVREIKLFKSKPVAQSNDIEVFHGPTETLVKRSEGSTIIKVEQIVLGETPLLEYEPVKSRFPDPESYPEMMRESIRDLRRQLEEYTIDAVIRITGNFYAGKCHLVIDENSMRIGSSELQGNLIVGGKGMRLGNKGFSMG